MTTSDNWRPGPDVPRAYRFEAAFCRNPKCGLHVIPFDRDDKPLCEIVMSVDDTLTIIERGKEHLYDKATRRI